MAMLVRNAAASNLPNVGQALLSHLGRFGSVGGAETARLLALSGLTVRLAANEDITGLASNTCSIVVVLDGMLQRYIDDASGKRQICGLYLRGDAPGLETLHMPSSDHKLSALVPSKVGLVNEGQVAALLQQFPTLRGLMWRATLVEASILRVWMLRNSIKDAAGQLAHLLCEWATRAQAAGITSTNGYPFPLTQRNIAEVTGMSAVHVNRTLMVLRSAGLVELNDGVLNVLHWDELSALGEFNPAYLHVGDIPRSEPVRSVPLLQSRSWEGMDFVQSRPPQPGVEPNSFRQKVAEYKHVLKTWSFVSSGLMGGEPDELRKELTHLAGDLRDLAGNSPENQRTMETLTKMFNREPPPSKTPGA